MVNVNANVNSLSTIREAYRNTQEAMHSTKSDGAAEKTGFADTVKAVEKHISKVDEHQQLSDMSIKDLLSGKNEDITSVISAVAKADMSFKLLVGVRNKLIEAYKQTMNMPL